MHPNPQHCGRTIPPGPQCGASGRTAVDGGLKLRIEAVIPRLRRYARAMVRDPVAADDLVQDCLARALAKIHLWQEGTDLRAWLFTVLHNQHVTLARRAARERGHIELHRYNPEPTLPPNQTARLELRDLERAIAQLPEEQRAAILLVGLEGMQYEEAATVLNLPVGTVRSRISRARETLRILTGMFLDGDRSSVGPAVNSAHARRREPTGRHSRKSAQIMPPPHSRSLGRRQH